MSSVSIPPAVAARTQTAMLSVLAVPLPTSWCRSRSGPTQCLRLAIVPG